MPYYRVQALFMAGVQVVCSDLLGHESAISAIALGELGRLALSAGYDCTVRCWSLSGALPGLLLRPIDTCARIVSEHEWLSRIFPPVCCACACAHACMHAGGEAGSLSFPVQSLVFRRY
eukprot:COSAG05_NODE_4321_length_1567_cov_329.445504_3_plen_119_part_00